MGTENVTFTRQEIDWTKIVVYAQSNQNGIGEVFNKGFNKGFNGHIHVDGPLIEKVDNPTQGGLISPGDAPGMLRKYNKAVLDHYETPILMKERVLRAVFDSVNEVPIFLGEIENEGLVFMYNDTIKGTYHILSDCDEIEDINFEIFTEHQNFYKENLKATLDTYIPKENPYPGNTKRFIVTNEIYLEFLKKLKDDSASEHLVAFYPAMHVTNDDYNNRFTFIMVVQKYVNNELMAPKETGLYDRNGLCPPGNC
ncbi:hypothetical protein [Chryseobacterium sp. Mn2064]|uniref:hypothetical protein n=1 Tax=Chryseobacterium sp. Mn2064 TaxID=3395263 RepID=UPI003BD203F9